MEVRDFEAICRLFKRTNVVNLSKMRVNATQQQDSAWVWARQVSMGMKAFDINRRCVNCQHTLIPHVAFHYASLLRSLPRELHKSRIVSIWPLGFGQLESALFWACVTWEVGAQERWLQRILKLFALSKLVLLSKDEFMECLKRTNPT